MKYIIDNVHPWEIDALADDLRRLTSPMTDFVAMVFADGETPVKLDSPPADELEKALRHGIVTDVIIARRRDIEIEPNPAELRSALPDAFVSRADPSASTATGER